LILARISLSTVTTVSWSSSIDKSSSALLAGVENVRGMPLISRPNVESRSESSKTWSLALN